MTNSSRPTNIDTIFAHSTQLNSQKAGNNVANFCNEPIKLNGSLPLTATALLSYDNELITSIASTQANTSPLNLNSPAAGARHQLASQRQHQVLIAGTGTGALKRIALVSGEHGLGLRGREFDSVQVDESQQEPILADMHLMPAAQNPQLLATPPALSEPAPVDSQFAVVATAYKVAKLRINACKVAPKSARSQAQNASMDADCNACAQLQDPFCGWCTSSSTCATRNECLQLTANSGSVHWAPFDQIRCADYQPVAPRFVAIQTSNHQPIDVNVRIQPPNNQATSQQWAQQLAQAQFTCHYDYLALANKSAPAPRLSGATTKATQARLNVHTSTVAIGCPLPIGSQRPQLEAGAQHYQDHVRAKLSVRLAANHLSAASESSIQQLLGLRHNSVPSAGAANQRHQSADESEQQLDRELTFYDCSARSTCRSCLSSAAGWSCAWCPLSNKCTFNASHPDFGCAASALVASTTPHSAPSPGSNSVRASHLTSSLDEAQATVFGASIERLGQCPAAPGDGEEAAPSPKAATKTTSVAPAGAAEILVPHNARKSIQVTLRQPLPSSSKRQRIDCLIEIEGATAKLPARLIEQQQVVVCQENVFTYQEEIASQRARLLVLLNDQQVIETTEVTLYKCHLFGVNPPALTSTFSAGPGPQQQQQAQPSSAAWHAHELLQLLGPEQGQRVHYATRRHLPLATNQSSDCSMCANVERKYQCVWCHAGCQHVDQCNGELVASTCPPPRIHSIHPNSGPLEGGTLLTIEGSNLGSNEREIQDKISVGGEACQLVMYSVSTRIVCKTGPSLHGPQQATVYVGNRAGVTSAYEKFHYKAVHLTDVSPRVGPVSGGTRLFLTGSNLNVGSRVQIFLDDIPCALDSHSDVSSNQITCVTAPNLLASSMRITRLTLMIDNSTHHLPYPFTYQPDPIITNIEPAESFLSGGRLILISGHHLASPQSTRLMVYHEHKRNIVNGTSCITQNDTLVTCLTPAISREMLASLSASASSAQDRFESGDSTLANDNSNFLSYDSTGLRLKIMLFMDDVKSVRNLDEYYHHLPHYMAYYEDPQLFRLPTPIVEYAEELVIPGENLKMRQLDQDMLITIGASVCAIKSVAASQVSCEPSPKVPPVYDDSGRLVERPLLPIVALIGSNLRYQIGHMRYSSRQYQMPTPGEQAPGYLIPPALTSSNANPLDPAGPPGLTGLSLGVAILVALSIAGFIVGFAATFVFALNRFRQSKAEREYKRIQLQMGSLDASGQPVTMPGMFDKVTLAGRHMGSFGANGSRALADYAAGNKKPLYQFGQASFPPSPLTDISSLTGGSGGKQQQHLVKLAANGTIVSSSVSRASQQMYNGSSSNNNNNSSSSSGGSSGANSNHANSAQSSPNSARDSGRDQRHHQQQQLQQHLICNSNQQAPFYQQNYNAQTRNLNWTQEAPATIVPYAVIEACNLTLEGKNAIKEFV